MSSAYYNEHDPYAAQWIRNLITAGHVADGEVDERNISDVAPDDLAGFTQCHFFAGIAVWSIALRRAGWDDSRPVWTGSCPCQPFSVAGAGLGHADERHLWPHWFHLIEQCRPVTVFGEQVEAAIRHGWLDLVQTDMEGAGYAFGAVSTNAAGVGAPHIRQRIYFVANSMPAGRAERRAIAGDRQAAGERGASQLADSDDARSQGRGGMPERSEELTAGEGVLAGQLVDADCAGRQQGQRDDTSARHGDSFAATGGDDRTQSAGPTNGFWRDADWLFCRDGKWRPVESGTSPLVARFAGGVGRNGTDQESDTEIPRKAQGNRVGRLRAYGNAICAPVAQGFIEAFMECRP